jgi:hypothetical protein
MPLPAGAKLGPYEILAPIGAGGMGEAYKARDPRLGRDVERHPMVTPTLQSAIAEPLRASPRWPRLAALMNLPKETEIS